MKLKITTDMADMLFAIEAALPFVKAHVGEKLCGSAGGPNGLQEILNKYDWQHRRWEFIHPSKKEMRGAV